MTHKNVFFLYSDIRKDSGIYANPKRIEEFATLESNMTSFICINQFTIFHSSLTKFYYINSSIVLKKNDHKIRYKKNVKEDMKEDVKTDISLMGATLTKSHNY